MNRVIAFLCVIFVTVSVVDAKPEKRFYQKIPDTRKVITSLQTNPTITAGTGGTVASSTNPVWTGSQSVRLTVGDVLVTFGQSVTSRNICSDSTFMVTMLFPSKQSIVNISRVDLALRNDGSNYITQEFSFYLDTNQIKSSTWINYTIHRRDFNQVGTFDCSQMDEIRFSLRSDAGTSDTLFLGEIASFGLNDKGVMILTTDDNWADFYQYGFDKMVSNGVCHTAFINGGLLGTSLKLTEGQLDNYYNRSNGLMKIGNHLWFHDTAAAIGYDSILKLLKRNHEWIESRGYNGASRLAAMPYGSFNWMVDSALRMSGVVDFQRGVRESSVGYNSTFPNPLSVITLGTLGNTMPLSTAVARMDSLALRKTAGIFYGHRLCDGCGIDGQTWDRATFTAFIDSAMVRVNSGRLRIMCLDDYLSYYGGGKSQYRKTGIGPK